MIVCVTPNPALDHTLTVPELLPYQIIRATSTSTVAGGKGLNAARAIRTIGGEVTCRGFLGGYSGRRFAVLAEREGLIGEWTWITEDTRTCIIVVDNHDGQATVINELGPHVSASNWTELQLCLTRLIDTEVICFSGSLPPGTPEEVWRQLLLSIRSKGNVLWVDTSGDALRIALSISGISIKINGFEAGTLLGRAIVDRASAIDAAEELVSRGLSNVVLTLGSLGAVFANASGTAVAAAPRVNVKSAVGSGDAFLGGLLVALVNGESNQGALRWGIAAGTANAMNLGGGHFTPEQFQVVLSQINNNS